MGQINNSSLMTFGKHKGKAIADVPVDYLEWWLKQNNREGLKIDAEFGSFMVKRVATKKLKLYDYINAKLQSNKTG